MVDAAGADDWFTTHTIRARLVDPSGQLVQRPIQLRTNPVSGRTSRIAFSRTAEKETGTDSLPAPPPDARRSEHCPFCRPQVLARTPRLAPYLEPDGHLAHGDALLFPNLFPYGAYSAVCLLGDTHFVEIGTASPTSYTDGLINCADYLKRVLRHDPAAVYMAITQNHLPSAGGSLVHPHLQVQADRWASNHHRFLVARTLAYRRTTGGGLMADVAACEFRRGERAIGRSGRWLWMAAFAPEGFFEIWAVLPGITAIIDVQADDWRHLAEGMIRVQRFYRSLNRNGYNFGLLAVESPDSELELRAVMMVRSNYAPWVRSDHTGFEVMLGEMATFTAPEETARLARAFWPDAPPDAS